MTSVIGPEIRPFRTSDYDEALALWRRCEGMGLSSADSREAITAYLERNPGTSLVAREAGVLVGTILCGHDGRRGYVHHLAVDPSHRRRSTGNRLVESALATLRARGIHKCHLFVYVDNDPAIGFWHRRGWEYRTDIAVMSLELDVTPCGPGEPAIEP
jgi:ribosomal protein S18 acetylase RimI-like enzyme